MLNMKKNHQMDTKKPYQNYQVTSANLTLIYGPLMEIVAILIILCVALLNSLVVLDNLVLVALLQEL